MSFYRVQPATFDPQAMVDDTEYQFSLNWADDTDVRAGVSVCASREDLATYLAQTGIPFADEWNLVEVDGYSAGEDDCDAHLGALLIIPTCIISTEPVSAGFGEQIIAAFETLEAA